ncbi:MAG TPA: hypothetical protein VFF36_13000, partial [Planctomycetota bacterium]|nr:hypothetical protein [Planctomycetota bacterium]
MRLPLALSLAAALGACGAAQPGERGGDLPRKHTGDNGEPFAAPADFKPVAFSARVTGRGRPVIFIPGLGCPGAVWDDTVDQLGDQIETHVLTLAGFAGT